MMINKNLTCDYPCTDVFPAIIFPQVALDPALIRMVMISEAPSADVSNYFYRETAAPFFQTTRTAFQDAGVQIEKYDDLTNLGIYLTTAIKCCKKGYLVSAATLKNCSAILEKELDQFPQLLVIMCLGDFAIRAVNYIFKRKTGRAPIRSGSTYRIRKDIFELEGIRFFPSYTQTGDSFDLEKSKRRMIAEDIRNALEYIKMKERR